MFPNHVAAPAFNRKATSLRFDSGLGVYRNHVEVTEPPQKVGPLLLPQVPGIKLRLLSHLLGPKSRLIKKKKKAKADPCF